MTYKKLTRQMQVRVAQEVSVWRLLNGTAGDAYANARVQQAVDGDAEARAIVRGLISDIIQRMNLPRSPLYRELEDYRAEVLCRVLERLDRDGMKSWRTYLARLRETHCGRFSAFVYVVAKRTAVNLTKSALKHEQRFVPMDENGLDAANARHVQSVEATRVLMRTMEQLRQFPKREIDGLCLRAMGYEWSTIAKMAGFPTEAAAAVAIRRARSRLRYYIKKPTSN